MTPSAPIGQRRLARLNRRQRKKLHVGEFQELGFQIGLAFQHPLDDAALDAFYAQAFAFLDAQGLYVGGLGGRLPLADTVGFIAARQGSVTDAQRAATVAWFQAQPQVSRVQVSDWVDAWHPGYDEPAMHDA